MRGRAAEMEGGRREKGGGMEGGRAGVRAGGLNGGWFEGCKEGRRHGLEGMKEE